jgi:drug/metabolite transporter (DMT)-like permease
MLYLVMSVILNTLISVIFRYFGKFGINNFAAIVVNYLICFLIGIAMTGGSILDFSTIPMSWVSVLLFLGSIFIVTFNLVAATVQIFSITVATLVQKMSVILVVIFSLVYYHEQLNMLRASGLIIGIVSIFLISGRPKKSVTAHKSWFVFALPILVFVLGGCIDSTFVHIGKLGLSAGREDAFTAYLFGTAGMLGLIYLLYLMLIKGRRYTGQDVWAGIALGVPNYFTVYSIQKMLTTESDGSVIFPIHNIGILLLSALVSKLIFSEAFTHMKIVGILLATVAIIILAMVA